MSRMFGVSLLPSSSSIISLTLNERNWPECLISLCKLGCLIYGNDFMNIVMRLLIKSHLRQRKMVVDEYSAKFNCLSRFAPHPEPTEEDRTYWLKNGLRPPINLKFMMERIKTTKEVIDRATVDEDCCISGKQKKESSAIANDGQGPSKKQNQQQNPHRPMVSPFSRRASSQ